MEEKQNKEIRLLIYLFIIVGIASFCYFLVYPKMNKVKEAQAEFLFYSKLLKEKEETLEEFNKTAALYKKNKANFQKISQAVLEEATDKVFLLVQFENLASENKMTMEGFSFGEITSGTENLGFLPVDLTIKGKYSDFKNYLDAIAQNLPMMEVESIQFSPTDEKSNLYNFTLKVNIYSKEVPQKAENQEGQNTDSSGQSADTSNGTSAPTPTPIPTSTTSPSPTTGPASTTVAP